MFSVRPARLAAPLTAGSEVPSLADLGLGWLEAEVTRWQLVRTQSWFFEVAAIFAAGRDRWGEVGLLFGSTAEGVLMAATSEVEITLLREHINQNAGTGGSPGAWLGLRFFAESQGQMTLSAGQRFANMLARSLMADPSYPWPVLGAPALKKPALAQAFPPFSDERQHWLTMWDLPDLLTIAKRSPHQSLRSMAESLSDLRASKSWKDLEDQRGKDFHRAREESPVVSRGERRSAWVGDTLNVGPPADADLARAQEDVGGIAATSRAALEELGRHMAPFRENFLRSMSDVSGGTIGYEDDRLKITPS